jgi:hypothetical protein
MHGCCSIYAYTTHAPTVPFVNLTREPLLQMKQIVFTLLLMAAAFQGYSKNTLLEEAVLETRETVLMDHFSTPSLDDCRITLRASIGFVMMEVSVSAPTCRGAFNEAMAALREAATSARDALK